jgi:hypothetical protein
MRLSLQPSRNHISRALDIRSIETLSRDDKPSGDCERSHAVKSRFCRLPDDSSRYVAGGTGENEQEQVL